MRRIQSWKVSDELWKRVEPFIPQPARDPRRKYLRKAGAGRKPIAYRTVFEGIVHVLRTGCQWKALSKESFGSASAIHSYFLKWVQAGLFSKLWEAGLTEYDELKGRHCLGLAKHRWGHDQGASGTRVGRAKPDGPGKKWGPNDTSWSTAAVPLSLS
jgi:transposase